MAAVQDDRRENEMSSLLGLRKGVGRSEVDAYCDFEESHCVYSVPVELKSTTTGSVSTACTTRSPPMTCSPPSRSAVLEATHLA